ncbi:DNA-directed RNA polymerase beta subunit [Candidatus Omnitrophus magneticus]|uniref:DNA-directed RNA polymerase subunit beta n=1 Tax=Candidatus Omnitrophus magneticus TaxID=1609969 RepID=A0A0F0CTC4_9BACT|nr:DNA-directed RNA polymerase beta subunit [Candidatus Omnitrophus magneticus]
MTAKKERHSYGKLKQLYTFPNLIKLQLDSYEEFLQPKAHKNKRENKGLEEVLREVFPLTSITREYELHYLGYELGKPKYDEDECKNRSITYATPLKINLRLKVGREIKEQEVYVGEIPLMTDKGTFVINGDERVVVSQLHRSPGISFEETSTPSGKTSYAARIIPDRGAWVEFIYDKNDILYVYIDRKRKFLATTFLRLFGLSKDEDILEAFGGIEIVKITRQKQCEELVGRVLAEEIIDEGSNSILAQKTEKITQSIADRIWADKIREIKLLKDVPKEIVKTMEHDTAKSEADAYLEIYKRLRPGDPPTSEAAKAMIDQMFFDKRRYSLKSVGIRMINRKLGMDRNLDAQLFDAETLVKAISYLLEIKSGNRNIDDIDHLGNRRIRSVGEQLVNQIRIAMVRLERVAKERMAVYDMENVMPHNLVNTKLIATAVHDFFARGRLSQFMDQTNPLAELTHLRRLSALGPGGLNRERAGFEVRDVHYSHYGRLCPIETPEGPNIGLINSLSTYAGVDAFGFLVTPYVKVENGKVLDKIEFLSADVEDNYIIAQANSAVDADGCFTNKKVFCRLRDDFKLVDANEVQYMDVSPLQLVSICAGIIPFLEHDDANRALMGSNMQRQAVPLMVPQSPLVGTGIEYRVAKDSGTVIIAKKSGVVTKVDASSIVIDGERYKLKKFVRTNARTCVNQRPLVNLGDTVKQGDIIADGGASEKGELALGRNVLVGFMSWKGYNFEDAIVISERVLKEDAFTSIHLNKFEIEARDTRLGNEEITRDIPNVGEDALKNLDENGIIRIGAEVKAGSILVGKVAPKSETELSPEEKLLRAIFGEKAGDVRDVSLKMPSGVEGIVVDVKELSRKSSKNLTKEQKRQDSLEKKILKEGYDNIIAHLEDKKAEKAHEKLIGQKLAEDLCDIDSKEILIKAGHIITEKDLNKIKKADLSSICIEGDVALQKKINSSIMTIEEQIDQATTDMERDLERLTHGDELPPGVLKRITVLVASKKRLQVGDKMAGRHGNKGVVAKIVPEEDMPYLPDGTPLDIVLNPLGVPSRMNIGQLLETQLGWAAKQIGIKVASPVFDGANEEDIKKITETAGLPVSGKIWLKDGLSGKAFDQEVTVGQIYLMKLAHLADDKMHARSIGPYSLVTQQPLGGKAQFGGQRFGEMEVWALEAYGAAYTLQELLTVKSDDVVGRTKVYEAIVKGENMAQTSTPESFNVLIKEIQSLALDIQLETRDKKRIEV